MKTIHLKCGHKISVKTWPSRTGLAKVRHHYKKFHPARMKKMTKKSLATKKKNGFIKNRFKTKRKLKKNPVHKSAIIYDKLLTIEARKEHGKFKGQNFYHDFKKDTDAVVMGNPDGSLTIRSKKGKPLWKRFNY